ETKALSVTQVEVLKAVENDIPVYAFVQERVLHDLEVYENNKDEKFIDDITFASIEDSSTARYIFAFIDYLRNRTAGNALIPFSTLEDITNHLQKQWSSLFQRLL